MIDAQTALARLALLLAEVAGQRDQALAATAELAQRIAALEAKAAEVPPADA